MNKAIYIPHPFETDEIVLPASIMALTEKIAENVHEVWAKSRIDEGWIYGPERNDSRKEHPCLVPYQELPEEEKEFDRNTALQTLRLIQKLGFTIQKTEQ